MRKKFVKELAVLGIISFLGQTKPVYAGWVQQDDVWRYEREGTWVRDSWVQEQEGWYYLESDGSMAVGWRQAGGFWYFLNPGPDKTYGKMMVGWQWIDGKCYYFAESGNELFPEGAMYVNARTPDGYQVNDRGAWVDEQGALVEIPGKGILTQGIFEHGRQGEERSEPGNREGSRNNSRGGRSSGSRNNRGGGKSSGSGDGSKNPDEKVTDKGMVEKENSNKEDTKKEDERWDYQKEDFVGVIGTATWSNAIMVDWKVCFVDEDTHQIFLAEPRQGKIQDGKTVTLNFRDRIVDSENRIWESVEKSPLKMEVYGPGNVIYYVEYQYNGVLDGPEDPDFNEKERLKEWLEKAKEQEGILTKEDWMNIPDSRIVAENQQENNSRLLTGAGQIPVPGEHVIYVIGKNFEPDGGILKNYYKDEMVYSKQVLDQFLLKGDTYTITRFSIARNVNPKNCSHIWRIHTEHQVGCVQTGQRIDRCETCGKEKEETLLPKGHIDLDTDQICDRCKSHIEENSMESAYWKIGDVLTGIIHGEEYSFRCIDQNYSDESGNHRQGALFLCDSVIPANFGSSYSYELLEDGTYGYVFSPGPIVNFGKSNDYKYSNIRKWLKEAEDDFAFAEDLELGVSYAYTGSTSPDMWEQFHASDLTKIPIGNQKLPGKLFVLSIDEALKYRQWLWRFYGSEEENPESVWGAFSKGYWLRNPVGNDTKLVYTVDLVDGRIGPVLIRPENVTGDEELCVTGNVGVRPAFVMPLKE